ncbi:MAG: hypothetical protein GXY83_29375 [Rhodopirellula sp.]|nr:hypothetical protein [Rhodopirellula sp.]
MRRSAIHEMSHGETPLVPLARTQPDQSWPDAQPPVPDDQEGRIRAALRFTGRSLPAVRIEWLRRYYEHLIAHLLIPFEAQCAVDIDIPQSLASGVTVVALLDPDKITSPDSSGLVCRVRDRLGENCVPLVDLEVEEGHVNGQLLEDYWYWIWNWRFDPRI